MMGWRTDRRRFIQTVSLASPGLPWLVQAVASDQSADKPSSFQIENQFFGVSYETKTGRLNAWRKGGDPFLIAATARVLMPEATRATSESQYSRTIEVHKASDTLGSGQQLVAKCTDRRQQVDFEIRITLYDGRDALVVETLCSNPSRKNSLTIQKIEPLRAVFDDGGACIWTGVHKVLTNGYMYYDPGRLEDFDRVRRRPVQSVWNMGFYRGEREPGLVIGFLENDFADGRIAAWYDDTVQGTPLKGGFSLTLESLCNQEMVLPPGASKTAGRLIFNIAPDPFTALESYAQAVGDVHKVRLNSIINGWCNWFFTHEFVTEEEIVRNTEFAAAHLKTYGLEYIQIDDGYQRAYGSWEGGDNFPHGMKWMANKIREHGLRPGIWVAPYCITDGTDVHQHHPDWLVRNLDGSIKLCRKAQPTPVSEGGYGDPQFMRDIYGLDITNPAAAEWMRKLFDTIANDWGYDFIKIDFVEWTLLAAERYQDPAFSKAAAYRKGFEIMRQATGPNRHLLDCGPMNVTVGLLDSTRIELDLAWLSWEQYVKHSNSNAPAMAKRYYFHKRTWINDDDHLGLALLTIPQAQAAASIIALSGGTMISGDRLIDLDPTRLEILKKVLPAYGVAARPIDLFERDEPEIFAVPVKRNFGEWLVVGIFNYDENAAAEKQVSLDRLRLDSAKKYVAHEFWGQSLLGEVQGELRVKLEPSSVALVALHEKLSVPQVVSTERHYAQGALELESVTWDGFSLTLQGVSLGPIGTAHNVAVYIPERYAWAEKLAGYFYDFGSYSLKLMGPQILRVHVRFDNTQRVPWEVKFKTAS
jgi:alpha-galactosidase